MNLLSEHTDQINRPLETKHWTQYLQLTTDTDWGEFQNQSMATVSTQHQALKYETPQYLPGKATQRYMFSVKNNISAMINPDLEALAFK